MNISGFTSIEKFHRNSKELRVKYFIKKLSHSSSVVKNLFHLIVSAGSHAPVLWWDVRRWFPVLCCYSNQCCKGTVKTILHKNIHVFSIISITVQRVLTLLHSEQPKLYRVLAVLSAIGLKKHQRDSQNLYP